MKKALIGLAFFLCASPALADSQGSALGGTAGTQSTAAGCIYQANPTPLTDGQQAALPCTTDHKVITNAASASVTVAPLTSSNLASSIAVTNTFQSIQVATGGRNGCTIQNQSTANTMWVYFGAIGGATKAKSFLLDTSHGLAISCSVGGLGVLTDQVSITGTSGDLYNANFQ